jgi:2-iminoacetate synthase ThiH
MCPWRCCPTTRSSRARAASLDLDGTIIDGGELTHSYSVESNNEVKMSKQEIISMIERAGFEAVKRDTVYNRVASVAV